MIAQPHAEIQRRFAAEEIVDLIVVERFQRLHDGVFRPLGEQTGFHSRQQHDARFVDEPIFGQRAVE